LQQGALSPLLFNFALKSMSLEGFTLTSMAWN
jgi:hypothetical protein